MTEPTPPKPNLSKPGTPPPKASVPPPAALPPASQPPASAPVERARVDSPAGRKLDGLPLLYAAGAAVLVLAVLYLVFNPQQPDTRVADTLRPQIEGMAARIAALEGRPTVNVAPVEGRVAALEGRLAQVETRPAPQPPDLGPLSARVDAAASKADVQALATRVDTLAPRTDLQALAARLDAAAAAAKSDGQALATRLDGSAAKTDVTALGARLDAAETRATALAQQARTAATEAATQSAAQLTAQVNTQLAAFAETSRRLQGVQAASVALNAGQRLGEMPGAPPALSRFAAEAPPTEAALRLSFDAAAEAARAATAPATTAEQALTSRMWARAQQTVTVRQGDTVVVGNPVNGVLTRAKQSLDAGDLAGTLQVLGTLSGPPADAMKPWTDRARALLDARAALATMARG